MKKIWNNFDKNYLKIFAITFLLFIPWVSRYYINGHDTIYHVANIYGLLDSPESIFQAKILPGIANNFGYGSPLFYPQFTHIITAFFAQGLSLFSLNILYSLKITHFLSMYFSGVFMYKLVKEVGKDKKIAFLAAIFYMTFPYHLADIFIRDALAEVFVFTFLPLIFLGLYYLFQNNKKKFYLCFTVGYLGLIFSHLVMAVYTTIFIIICFLFNLKKVFKKDNIVALCVSSFLILLLSLPFLIPLLEHKFFGDYVVFLPNYVVNEYSISKEALSLFDLFLLKPHESTNIMFFLNIFVGYLAIVGCINYKKICNAKNKWVLQSAIVFTALSLLMINEFFSWKMVPSLLLLLQFPWRLETFLAFGISILAAFSLLSFSKDDQKIKSVLALVLSGFYALFVLSNINYVKMNLQEYDLNNLGMGYQKEYLPVNTLENYDYFSNRNQDVIIKNGHGKINILENDVPYLLFETYDVESSITLELPRLFYFGYSIIGKDVEGNAIEIQYEENENGFIQIVVDENLQIEVKYIGTKLDQLANWLSAITLIFLIVFGSYFGIKKLQKTKKMIKCG